MIALPLGAMVMSSCNRTFMQPEDFMADNQVIFLQEHVNENLLTDKTSNDVNWKHIVKGKNIPK